MLAKDLRYSIQTGSSEGAGIFDSWTDDEKYDHIPHHPNVEVAIFRSFVEQSKLFNEKAREIGADEEKSAADELLGI
ncbi:MAG: hypothetical protein ACREDM_08980 [Methylocella sp.]